MRLCDYVDLWLCGYEAVWLFCDYQIMTIQLSDLLTI